MGLKRVRICLYPTSEILNESYQKKSPSLILQLQDMVLFFPISLQQRYREEMFSFSSKSLRSVANVRSLRRYKIVNIIDGANGEQI